MISVPFVSRATIAMCLLMGAAQSFGSAATPASAGEPITAIWKVQRIEFIYRSTNIYYSCDGLRNKIMNIVTALGARENVSVDLRCRPGGIVNDAVTLITLASPVEATEVNVTEATTYSPETQLAARLKRVRLPTANDIHRFPAEWRLVQLNRDRRMNLEAGDCELLHGLIAQVFPHMSVRVEKQRLNCSLGSGSRVRPVLHVAALSPMPVVPMAFAPAAAE